MQEPAIALNSANVEGHVSQPQARVPSLFVECLWPTPVLREEKREVPTRVGEVVVWVERAQYGIRHYTVVERVDEPLKEWHAVNGIV